MTTPEEPVEIVPYDPLWPQAFEEERQTLQRVLDAEVAAEYETLKRHLAQEHQFDREAYTEAKRPFIARITAVALDEGYGPNDHGRRSRSA